MYLIRLIALTLAATLASFALALDDLKLSLNHNSGLYEKGDTITVSATTNAPATLRLKVLKNNNELLSEKEISLTNNTQTIYQASFDEPCSIIVEASLGEQKDAIGAIFAADQFRPASTRPDDFDTFWEGKKKAITEQVLEVTTGPITLTETDAGYQAYNVEISSPGPRPARGIFAKPSAAQPASLPIVLFLRAAGVKGEWCRSHLDNAVSLAKRGHGALTLDLNAHGMLNHEQESYYEELENGPLNAYWEQGFTDRDDYYFGYMYARMLRSIEFLTQQPEWDGKRILVIGESQGGGQALAAVGLDHRVTAAVVTVPALCDLSAPLAGRKGGWPQPIDWHRDNAKAIETVPYFDTAHLLAGSRATIVVEIGLIDRTCPATSIYAAVNQAAGSVTILPVPYRGHPWPEGEDRTLWDQTTNSDKNAFIDAYLQ